MIWTVAAIALGIIFSPSPCSGDDPFCIDLSGLFVLLLFSTWLLGLGVTWFVAWLFGFVVRLFTPEEEASG